MGDNLKDILIDGEEVLWQGKPKKTCYVLRKFGPLLPFALLWLLFDGFFIGTMIASDALGEMWPFMLVFFALHLLPVWLCIGKFISSNLEHKNIEYVITTRRIIARTGIIGLDFESIDYVDISNVNVNVSVVERLFKVGTVVTTTSSEKLLCFYAIENPYEVYKQINKLFIDIKSDVHFPNAYRPDVNPGYNTDYKG